MASAVHWPILMFVSSLAAVSIVLIHRETFSTQNITCISVLVGKNSDGSFRTAPAKQYPGPMNLLLASVTFEHLCDKLPNDLNNSHLTHEILIQDFVSSPLGAFYVPLDPYNTNQVLGQFGADFTSNSGAAEESSHLLCPPAKIPAPCPLTGIRAQVRTAL